MKKKFGRGQSLSLVAPVVPELHPSSVASENVHVHAHALLSSFHLLQTKIKSTVSVGAHTTLQA